MLRPNLRAGAVLALYETIFVRSVKELLPWLTKKSDSGGARARAWLSTMSTFGAQTGTISGGVLRRNGGIARVILASVTIGHFRFLEDCVVPIGPLRRR